ncbi:MAG: hypothetical protein AAFS10_12290, partial [Myxococcota bacterium]
MIDETPDHPTDASGSNSNGNQNPKFDDQWWHLSPVERRRAQQRHNPSNLNCLRVRAHADESERPARGTSATKDEDLWQTPAERRKQARRRRVTVQRMLQTRQGSGLTGAAVVQRLQGDSKRQPETTLSPDIASTVAQTTGQHPGSVPIVQGQGHGARVESGAIVLGSDIPDASHPQGRRVRIHETVHLLQQRLPSPDRIPNGNAHQRRAAVELEAAQITDVAMAGGRRSVRRSADPMISYAFTELAEAQVDLWKASLETVQAPLEGLGDDHEHHEDTSPNGTDTVDTSQEGAATSEPAEADKPEVDKADGTESVDSERPMETASK